MKNNLTLTPGVSARALAEALVAYQHKESLVTAVYGPWGSGKSSVINVLLERVAELSRDSSKLGSDTIYVEHARTSRRDEPRVYRA